MFKKIKYCFGIFFTINKTRRALAFYLTLTTIALSYHVVDDVTKTVHTYISDGQKSTVIQSKVIKVQTKEVIEEEIIEEDEEVTAIAPSDNRVAQIVEGIYMMESSGGKNNYSKCEEQGKLNGYGYGIPGNGKYLCFDTHEDATESVKKWVEKKMASGYSEKELLCIYNTGSANDCAYYETIKSLI